MMTTKPKISVIIPVYNRKKWLNKGVDSILAQSYENFELVLYNMFNFDVYIKYIFEKSTCRESATVLW